MQRGEHFELYPGDALGDGREKRRLVVASNRVDPLYKVVTLPLVRDSSHTNNCVIPLFLTAED